MRSDSVALLDAITALAAVVGLDVPRDAVDDEHARWAIYEAAMHRPEARPALLRLVRLEPEHVLAETVVLRMLEEVDEADQGSWIEAQPVDGRGLTRWRAREVSVARSVAGTGADPDDLDVGQWSDWLQRRVAQDSGRLGVLDALAADGRTRRVRAMAAESARRRRTRG